MFGVKNTAFSFRQQNFSNHDNEYSDSTAYLMLTLHNRVRQDLASGNFSWPPASDMRLMVWDQELESLAQQSLALWLSTSCTLSPSECFWTTPIKQFAQNYAVAGYPGRAPNIEDIFDSWTIFGSTKSMENPSFWKSFSNVMSASSFKLGCGQTVLEERNHHARFVLCYYDPGSISQIDDVIIDESFLYKRGVPCSECPYGTACNASSIYPNLCAIDDTIIFSSRGMSESKINIYHPMLVVLFVTSFNR
ncbi:hypothetical protein GE061_007492 [Apolygus lucorum]|uniref:SCP domain-containing protein n=1 Tax=Apolygus lucorum TaxID=248454 RepID=A0A8S9WUG0_APOLU|nr:hypothetical protein GE061_007492 [Apolygus lucorum]